MLGVGGRGSGCLANGPTHLDSPRLTRRAHQSAEFIVEEEAPSPTQRPSRRYIHTVETLLKDTPELRTPLYK